MTKIKTIPENHIDYSLFDGEGFRMFVDNNFEMSKIAELVSNDLTPKFSLSNGLSGIAWALKIKYKDQVDVSDFFEGLKLYANQYNQVVNFDYLYGSTGIISALVEIDSNSLKVANDYVDTLNREAIYFENGSLGWISNIKGENKISFGLAHGVNAIACTLAKILKKHGNINNCEKLLQELTDLLIYKIENQLQYNDTIRSVDGKDYSINSSSRLAWCYGELCDLIALISINQVLESSKISSYISKLQRDIPKQKEHGITNACLCHGSTGLALMCHVLYSKYNFPIQYKKISAYWESVTRKYISQSGTVDNLKFDNDRFINSGLSGRWGVYLGIATLTGKVNSDWTKILLL